MDFVVAPGNTTIWTQVGKDGVPTRQFWTTRDGGQTWNPQPAPLAEQYAIGPKTSSTAETICATNYSASHGAGASNQLFCSSDGGGHWSTRDGLNVPATIAVGPAHAGEIPPIQLLAVASDGAVLALDDGSPTPRIYRLPAGASQWQLIAALPIPARMVVIYCPQPGAGVLWASNMGGQAAQPNKMLFTASYS